MKRIIKAYNKIISAEGKWIGMSSETVTMYLLTLNLRNKPNFMLDQVQLSIAPESIILVFSGNLKKNISLNLLGKSMTFMHNGHQSNILYVTALKRFGMTPSSGTIPKGCEALNKATSHQPKLNYLTITLSAGKSRTLP